MRPADRPRPGTAPAPRVALVLAVYNAAADLPSVMAEIATAIAAHPDVAFRLYVADDGSTDDSAALLTAQASRLGIPLRLTRATTNIGLAPTLRTLYARVLADTAFQPTHTIKLDADADYPALPTLAVLRPWLEAPPSVVVGERAVQANMSAYEVARRTAFAEHLAALATCPPWPDAPPVVGAVPAWDPASIGIQCFAAPILRTLLAHPLVRAHPDRWALDLLLPLVAWRQGWPVHTQRLPRGHYDPARRPDAKVDAQFTIYAQVVARVAAWPLPATGPSAIGPSAIGPSVRPSARPSAAPGASGPWAVRVVVKPWGHETIWAETAHYVGKRLHITAGASLSVQYHRQKDEVIHVLQGTLIYRVADRPGEVLREVRLGVGDSYRNAPGHVHQMEAVTDCVLLEVSTPHLDDVVRLQDRYGRAGTSAP